MTKYLGVIGYPLRHTLSPVFQQAALDHCGIDARYEAWETPPEELAAMVTSLRADHRLGMNVTLPHKQAIIPLLDRLDTTAAQIGAVNTVVKSHGQLVGYNTDGTGFLRALREDGGFQPAGRTVLLLGAGGGARAVVYALLTATVQRLTIAARRTEQAHALAESFADLARSSGVTLDVTDWETGRATAVPTADLVVNATSVGMLHGSMEGESPLGIIDIREGAFVYDLVYNPAETPLLRQAQAAGSRPLGGLSMLVYQGATGFTHWTGQNAPVAVMLAAARNALYGGT